MALWAIGKFDLGLTEEEFFALTPRQFFALQDRWLCRIEVADYQAAFVASAIINSMRGKDSKPVSVAEILPDRRGKKKVTTKKQNWQDQLALVKHLHAFFGGAEAPPVLEPVSVIDEKE